LSASPKPSTNNPKVKAEAIFVKAPPNCLAPATKEFPPSDAASRAESDAF